MAAGSGIFDANGKKTGLERHRPEGTVLPAKVA
jgi:hypothetical protein